MTPERESDLRLAYALVLMRAEQHRGRPDIERAILKFETAMRREGIEP